MANPNPKKVIGFVRDMGTGNVVAPILNELRIRGHNTLLFIENGGKAEGRVVHPASVLGTESEIQAMFEKEKPDIVIAGLSAPNRNLESVFEEYARAHDIPVVHAEDSLLAFARSGMRADLILSIDEAAASLVLSKHQHARIAIVGFAGIMPLVPRPEVVADFERVRRQTGAKILYCNDADPRDSESTVSLLVESILLTKTPVRLIFVPHPKFAPMIVSDGRMQSEVLRDIIKPLHKKGLLMRCPPGADGDEGVMLADATCSGYSTLLGRAAASGRTALTLRTPEAARAFKEYTGLDKTWFMIMNAGFPIIEKPTPLDEILAAKKPVFRVRPLDVRAGASAIEKFIS